MKPTLICSQIIASLVYDEKQDKGNGKNEQIIECQRQPDAYSLFFHLPIHITLHTPRTDQMAQFISRYILYPLFLHLLLVNIFITNRQGNFITLIVYNQIKVRKIDQSSYFCK